MVNGVHDYSSWFLATSRWLWITAASSGTFFFFKVRKKLFKVNEEPIPQEMPFRTLSGAEGEESAPLL
jgi:hypothetical protein